MAVSRPVPVLFEGDSRDVIRTFSEEARESLGLDLRRLQNGERPLDGGSMAPALPGVFELRDQDRSFWYRVLYVRLEGAVYVLHCFTKKTDETSQKDINIARARLSALKERLALLKKRKK